MQRRGWRFSSVSRRCGIPLGTVSLRQYISAPQLSTFQRRSRLRSPSVERAVVAHAIEYGRGALMKMRVKELVQLMIDNGIPGRYGTKSELVNKILTHSSEGDATSDDGDSSEDLEENQISQIRIEDKDSLCKQLNRFTLAELKSELRKRGAALMGRKVDVVERLALVLIREQRPDLLPPGAELERPGKQRKALSSKEPRTEVLSPMPKFEDIPNLDEYALRSLLSERMGERFVDYSMYLDVRHFVECLVFDHETQKIAVDDIMEKKKQMMHRIADSIRAVQADNENILSLKRRCRGMDVMTTEDDTREDMLEKLATAEAKWMQAVSIESPTVQRSVFKQLLIWLEEIQSELQKMPLVTKIDDLTDQEVTDRLVDAQMRVDTAAGNRDLLKKMVKMEMQFYPRSLMLLTAQLIVRIRAMPVTELGASMRMANSLIAEMRESDVKRRIVQSAFLTTALITFDLFYDHIMKDAIETEIFQEEHKIRIGQDLPAEVQDPAVSIGLIFGGGRSRAIETFSSVRCLLDHLQTAPNSTQSADGNGHSFGMDVSLYYISVFENRMDVYKMTLAEFFSLETSTAYKSLDGICSLGERIADFEDFLTELELQDCLISLTPALDEMAAKKEGYSEHLKKLDRFFVGTPATARHLAHDRYACLTYLRSLGFIVPPIFKIQNSNLEQFEAWNRQFRHWCTYHHLKEETQHFFLRPSSACERLARIECKGLGEMLKTAEQMFESGGAEEAVVQPVMAEERFVEFSCVVLEAEGGPVALAPTEFETLRAEHVRSFASPFRRHTPPRFTTEKVNAMRRVAEKAFKELGLAGYACVHGRILVDPKKEDALKNEELTYPRPIPDIPSPNYDVHLTPQFMAHMKKLQAEQEVQIEDTIRDYDETSYTLDTLRLFEAMDESDAKNGVQRNRYLELDQFIDGLRFRHRKKAKRATSPGPLQYLQWSEVIKEALDKEQEQDSPTKLSTGNDFSIMVTGVETSMPFTVDSLLFHQAAVSGLSHNAVLRHLINLRLPFKQRLPEASKTPRVQNPFFPELYVDVTGQPATDKRPRQVWILCGGDGTGHQASLTSGFNAMMKLGRASQVQPYLFILDAGRRVKASPEVLHGLQERRSMLLQRGVTEEYLLPECSTGYLNNPGTIEYDVAWRPVLCLNYAHALLPTIDEAVDASERFRLYDSTATLAHITLDTAFKENLLTCQKEIHEAGVKGVAGLWGGKVNEMPPTPRTMTLDMFATEAASVGATVFLAVHGDIAQDGTLQNFLESHDVPYTGCDVTATMLCGDKDETAQYLRSLKSVSVLPQGIVTREVIQECGSDMELAELCFQETFRMMPDAKQQCIKPVKDAFGGGVVRLSSARDLFFYGKALKEEWVAMSREHLTQPHCTVPMPIPPAEKYIIEPYMTPAAPFLGLAEDMFLSRTRTYVEVSFGLVGNVGQMWVMNPSLILTNLETKESVDERLARGMKSAVTPVPPTVASSETVEKAKKSVERLADDMGLGGVARVDAFMHVRSGKLIIIEVDTTPYLGEHSVLLQQGVVESPPMFPDELFQQILNVPNIGKSETLKKRLDIGADEDWEEKAEGEQEEETNLSEMSPWEDNEFWETPEMGGSRGADVSEPPETLSNLWGNEDGEEDASTETQGLQNAS